MNENTPPSPSRLDRLIELFIASWADPAARARWAAIFRDPAERRAFGRWALTGYTMSLADVERPATPAELAAVEARWALVRRSPRMAAVFARQLPKGA